MANPRIVRLGLILSTVLISVLIIAALLSKEPPNSLAFAPLPNPNGYTDLLHASRILIGPVPDLANASPSDIQSFTRDNPGALEAVQLGLSRSSRVTIEFSQTYLNGHMNELGGIKRLAQLLVVRAKAAQLEGKTAEAVRFYLDAIRLGQAVSQGGLVIDIMVGQACQGLGMKGLRSLRSALKTAEMTEIIQVLTEIDAKTESSAAIFAREKVFFRRAYGLWQTVGPRIATFIMTKISGKRPMEATAEDSLLRGRAKFRLFIIELALESFKAQAGHYPDSLAALEPKLSDESHRDPFSGQGMIYQRQENGYRLYSVGPDRKDDGGRAIPTQRRSDNPLGDLLPE